MECRRKAGASCMKVILWHLPTSLGSTQHVVLIQTFKLEWEWHLDSCDACCLVFHLSLTTAGLVIQLGLPIIHSIGHFLATALEVFTVSFTIINQIFLYKDSGLWMTSSNFHPAQAPSNVEEWILSLWQQQQVPTKERVILRGLAMYF